MRLLGWIRMRLGRCQMGTYGCSRRPVGTWRPLPSALLAYRLCAECETELERVLEEMPLVDWTPD